MRVRLINGQSMGDWHLLLSLIVVLKYFLHILLWICNQNIFLGSLIDDSRLLVSETFQKHWKPDKQEVNIVIPLVNNYCFRWLQIRRSVVPINFLFLSDALEVEIIMLNYLGGSRRIVSILSISEILHTSSSQN